jgi:hypothetical protein
MKNFILIITILFGMTVTACYSDNFVVKTLSFGEDEFLRITWNFKGNGFMTSASKEFFKDMEKRFDLIIDQSCYDKLQVGEKIPDCLLPAIKWNAQIR